MAVSVKKEAHSTKILHGSTGDVDVVGHFECCAVYCVIVSGCIQLADHQNVLGSRNFIRLFVGTLSARERIGSIDEDNAVVVVGPVDVVAREVAIYQIDESVA